jgi:hypothetical protein
MGIEKLGGREVRLSNEAQENFKKRVESENSSLKNAGEISTELMAVFTELMGEVDFDLLWNSFEKELLRSGVGPERLNRLLPKDFDAGQNVETMQAYYDLLSNTIRFDINFIAQIAQERAAGEKYETGVIQFIRLLVHEMAHAVSATRVESVENGEQGEGIAALSGYASFQGTLADAEFARSFEAFNEGVTERIAQEIETEYVKSKGEHVNALAQNISTSLDPERLSHHSLFMSDVQIICEKVGDYVGIPAEVVWKGIKQGYFAGGTMFEENTLAMLSETFGSRFVDDLSNRPATASFDTLKFSDRYDLTEFGDPEVVNRWLAHLKIDKQYLAPGS